MSCIAPYVAETGTLEFFWVPEAPKHPGVYAVDPKKKTRKEQNCTVSIHDALKFKTKKECDNWCLIFPEPLFVPKEHGYSPI